MDLRSSATAIWIWAALLAYPLLPSRSIDAPPTCADEDRLLLLVEPGVRGKAPRLVCPGEEHAEETVIPGGAVGLLMGRPVDLNRATEGELRSLPGIGPGLARKIHENRETHGPFQDVEDLSRIRGLGPSRIRALRWLAVAFDGPEGR